MWVISFTSYLHCMFSPHNVESAQNWVESSERIIWEQSFSQTLSLSLSTQSWRRIPCSPTLVREAQCLFFFQSPNQKCEVCVLKLLLSFKEAQS